MTTTDTSMPVLLSNQTSDLETVSASSKWNSRKLWFCVLVVLVSTWALYAVPKVSESSWLAIITACVWAYVVGNVGSRMTDSIALVVAAALGKKSDTLTQ